MSIFFVLKRFLCKKLVSEDQFCENETAYEYCSWKTMAKFMLVAIT